MRFVLSGWDERLGGGIYWRPDHKTKNTCSNGPGATAGLVLCGDTGVAHVATAYDQATKAVQIGRRIHGQGTVIRFDSLGVFRLLSLIDDAEELRSFALESLGPLLRLDPAERDDLLRTLEALVECNLNVARAARRLYFHYNTLRYRITKLERLLGPFTADPDLCLQIGLALQIIRIREVLHVPDQLPTRSP